MRANADVDVNPQLSNRDWCGRLWSGRAPRSRRPNIRGRRGGPHRPWQRPIRDRMNRSEVAPTRCAGLPGCGPERARKFRRRERGMPPPGPQGAARRCSIPESSCQRANTPNRRTGFRP
jgi:hypothetical protein